MFDCVVGGNRSYPLFKDFKNQESYSHHVRLYHKNQQEMIYSCGDPSLAHGSVAGGLEDRGVGTSWVADNQSQFIQQ